MQVIDQINHQFELKKTPERIISLVPSQTELLYDLGLENEVVGITKFCIHPNKWHKSKVRVGGTKTLNFSTIEQLNPDLIIANKEENTKSEIEYLQKKYPVYTSDINSLQDSLEMISVIGKIVNKQHKSEEFISRIKLDFEKLDKLKKTNKTVVYLIWKNPEITIGTDTFIYDMLVRSGFKQINFGERYPDLSNEKIQSCSPDFIFLSSEPYPFKEKDIPYFKSIFPNSTIVLVNGEMFSWYGSRLLKSTQYFIDLNDKIS